MNIYIDISKNLQQKRPVCLIVGVRWSQNIKIYIKMYDSEYILNDVLLLTDFYQFILNS